MTDVKKRAEEIASALQGSCEAAPNEVFETDGLAEALDELVFQCEECGWWCEISEMANEADWLCRQCVEDI